MKTANLIGPALDWAVAKCDQLHQHLNTQPNTWGYQKIILCDHQLNEFWYEPSTNWAQGGPILDREQISLLYHDLFITGQVKMWEAGQEFHYDGMEIEISNSQTNTTPLIAAMRCYVASKLGDEVELPEGLS